MRGLCIILLFVVTGNNMPLQAQQGKSAHPGPGVFDDLPVDDAASRSVLGPHEDAAKKIRDNIFVIARLDRALCFVGQQVLLTCKLYTALQSNSTVAAKPSLDGFSSTESQPGDSAASHVETRGGKQYRVFTVWRVILAPLQAGDFSLDPLTVNNEVTFIKPDGSPGHYSGSVTGSKVVIHVLPLPVRGRLADFSGAVGQWEMHCSLAAAQVNTQDPDTLFIKMEGWGNFDGLPAPSIRWPPGFRVFPPVERLHLKENSFPRKGRKEIAIPFTASAPGKFVLGQVELSCFDPVVREYYVMGSAGHELEVRGAAFKEALVHPVKGAEPSRRLLLYGLALAGGAGVVFLLVLRRRHGPGVVKREAPQEEDEEGGPDLSTRLTAIEGIPDEEGYLAGVKQLLIGHLQEGLGTDAPAEEHLIRLLRASDSRLADEMQQLLELCNRLLYSPQSWGPEMRSDLRSRVIGVLIKNAK